MRLIYKLHIAFFISALASISWGLSLTQTLSKHERAMGGSERLSNIKTIVMKGKIMTGGLAIDYLEEYLAPNKLRQEQTVAGRTTVMVYDGKEVWSKDSNGRVVRLAGQEAKAIKLETYTFGMRYIADHSLWKYFKLGKADPKTHQVPLTFSPPDASSATLFLDEKSFRPQSVKQREDGDDVTATQQDYRTISGMPFAFESHISNGRAQFDQQMSVTAVEVNTELPSSLFTKPAVVSDLHWRGDKRSITLPFYYEDEHLFTEIKINEVKMNVLIDTGAGATVLTKATVKKLKLSSTGAFEVKGGGGSSSGGIVNGVSFSTDAFNVSDQSVTTLDVPIMSFFSKPVGGILGYDFLSRFVVTFDYEKHSMTLSDPENFTIPSGGKTVAMELDDHTPVIYGSLDGQKLKLRLDTGANGSVSFAADFVKAHDFKKKYPKFTTSESAGTGGIFTETKHRIKSFTLGGEEVNNIIVTFSEDKGVASEDVQGNVGNQVLSQFTLILDYPRQQATLIPNRTYGKSQGDYKVGIAMTQSDNGVKLMIVVPGSPADKAGLKAGDKLLSINGYSLVGKTPAEAHDQIDPSKKMSYNIKVKRGDQELTFNITSKLELDDTP